MRISMDTMVVLSGGLTVGFSAPAFNVVLSRRPGTRRFDPISIGIIIRRAEKGAL